MPPGTSKLAQQFSLHAPQFVIPGPPRAQLGASGPASDGPPGHVGVSALRPSAPPSSDWVAPVEPVPLTTEPLAPVPPMAPRLPPTTGVPLVMEPLSVPAALTRLDPELEPLTAPAAAPPIVPETLSLVPLARPPQAAM